MRIALCIEYDGASYHGWQSQKDVTSVQEELEKALMVVANEPIEVMCAGRTDAGVHGTGQVVHFDTNSVRKLPVWMVGVNANLPKNIAVRWVKEVNEDFHARFTATARRYRYIIFNNRQRPAIFSHGVSHYHETLDADLMHEAGQYLLGENDFTSFRAVRCQSRTPWRNLIHLKVTRHGDFIVIDIKANAFVHHMVRNITGSLIEVGRGKQKPEWVQWLLEAKDRKLAGATAKAEGLYLIDVDYPKEWDLPRVPLGPLFLPDN
ncbi:tRNA pseudouridine(38-40) synthase TruA [Aliivibrio salmonicida]|jgi:tRNA pseudouridine38-40 synthase|uniref:tRNA pseudouridine synthase A n=1 Tax=Aliivibrio salmonicida (strain LFI1238) TaxID=316275 RepID=TRUA_ALISL|nr:MULTISPECIES: tRNA pseudouridine(38-40) synthase TruA [Aliivibrio]B6EIW6.1 RecName: Full=tRNA pseudouridine synthase A; AltName: Full=tRNA pseudouridine(38-40) synthase; AltName: Full=tRNA pseudouridylate synthase I; AltName: Full=tRNA-uridine isomerase I [Aliivibrio salmonicida LFI1238]AZL84415.1 tRNA pseudouridine(38-40) synthase TruA [Aliivibrio salmonicida]CAQ78760.1 tRNA pseudouridine synthase A [Aliivibrio salmonicida LFI1238]